MGDKELYFIGTQLLDRVYYLKIWVKDIDFSLSRFFPAHIFDNKMKVADAQLKYEFLPIWHDVQYSWLNIATSGSRNIVDIP